MCASEQIHEQTDFCFIFSEDWNLNLLSSVSSSVEWV